jgi:hypothetical protein
MIRGKQFGSVGKPPTQLKDEVTCRAVKGPDERPVRDALDVATLASFTLASSSTV